MHSTENVNDGYLGSGKRIKAEIKKYGKENFVKEILEHLPTREALCKREAELVDGKLLADPLCLNLKNGGEGGWFNTTRETRSKGGKVGGKIMNMTFTSGSDLVKLRNERSAQTQKLLIAEGKLRPPSFAGYTHTEETKQMMRKPKNQGEKNSQHGTCWVTDGIKPIKIKKEHLDEYLTLGFTRGRTSPS